MHVNMSHKLILRRTKRTYSGKPQDLIIQLDPPSICRFVHPGCSQKQLLVCTNDFHSGPGGLLQRLGATVTSGGPGAASL